MNIDNRIINENTNKKYCFIYIYEGLILFFLGLAFVMVYCGEYLFKFSMFVGKITYNMFSGINKKKGVKNGKKK